MEIRDEGDELFLVLLPTVKMQLNQNILFVVVSYALVLHCFLLYMQKLMRIFYTGFV